ncbi:MAG: sigma-54-dependent Fis family transcriptional regulator [Candidatus Abyssobacteria bacterium SURF_5]|uniref:Sigma-54-dependent Fis family transcriptional regulator n=1 Tax=Abyssobacteria bacterium (strain SURF_5) TaxID=2093360 RepID=A0A3A4P0Q3_ABYX5|nr:MAG: sigma-54-dependent Fis family transcriptional regulator [Candidatus Abyssubacteria bacterium SURF_5]
MEKVSILVIDDEQIICKGCQLTLAGEQRTVDCCSTGTAGMNALRTGSYDVVLLDMKLPDMDGMEILRAVRKEKPRISVVVMTGYSTIANAVEAMKLGAFDYLTKPFTDDQLSISVEKAIENKRLVEENYSLRQELLIRSGFNNIVGANPAILRIFDQIQKMAPSDSTVLIFGESGTGKELFAAAIHAHSPRAAKQFLAVDCSALSPGLLESELFGHVRGAFTGAIQNKTGIFETANGGTLFLDDIANVSLDIQAKLLRVLEAHEYKPVGASVFKRSTARIIAATNKDLRKLVDEGVFREDLFYRLNVFPIYLPPLRERRDDIPMLAYHFLRHFCRKTGKRINGFTDDALETLVNYDWPGNVRQLKNVIERLVILSDSETLDLVYLLDHFQMKRSLKPDAIPSTIEDLNAIKKDILETTFGQIQKAFILKALQACNGNISRAAESVGMQRPNFHALMRKHKISAKDLKKQIS